MSKWDLTFGLTDKLDRLLGCDGNDERLRVGHADIFGCGNHEASGNEADVFTAFEHSGEPVEGGVRIRATDALYEGGGGIVVLVAVAVINDGFALDAFFGFVERELDDAFGVGRCGEDSEFQRVEAFTSVAFTDGGKVSQRVGRGFDGTGAESAPRIFDGPLE